MQLVLVAAGVVILAVGVRLVYRVRRWSPRVSPDLSDYDPGPDALDWARAMVPILIGLALVVVAIS